jgi:hypothetical protein
MLCGQGRVRTQDLGYQAEHYDHCATRPVEVLQVLTIEVGIAGDVRTCLRKTVRCRFRFGVWSVFAKLLLSSESFRLAIFSHNGFTCIQCATCSANNWVSMHKSTLWEIVNKCIRLRSTPQACNKGWNSLRYYQDAWRAHHSTPGEPFLSRFECSAAPR